MIYFLDSANTEDWRELMPCGCFSGITTNPLLLRKAALNFDLGVFRNLLAQAGNYPGAAIYFQTKGEACEEILKSANELLTLGKIRLKIPFSAEGIKAASILKRKGAYILMTGVYTAEQCSLALATGLPEVAVYHGRILKEYGEGEEMIRDIAGFSARNPELKILMASLKTPAIVGKLAAAGFNRFTVSPEIARGILNNPFSLRDAAEFNTAAANQEATTSPPEPTPENHKSEQN